MSYLRYSYPSADVSEAVLHTSEDSYSEAVNAGHKDTYAPEAWKTEGDSPTDEKAALRAKLKESGIAFGPNSGLEKLRELVASIPEA